MIRSFTLPLALCVASLCITRPSVAQQVCLPLPRLLTVTPMGGQVGTSVEVSITHQHIDEALELLFSTPQITAKRVVAADGQPVPNRFVVTIASDAPVGVHDARILSRLGVSTPRAFAVGDLPEIICSAAHQTIQTALALTTAAV